MPPSSDSDAGVEGRPDTDVSTDTDAPAEAGVLSGPSVVRLAAAEVGVAPPDAPLRLTASGATGPLTLAVTGPFAVQGDLDPVDGERVLTVSCNANADTVANLAGSVEITQGTQRLTVALAAAILAPDLPEGLVWTDEGQGLSTYAPMPSAPFPTAGSTWDDPTVWIWIPGGVNAPFATVTHLHGHNARLAETLPAQHLPALFRAAARNAIVIAPQGPEKAASGQFGKLMLPGGHAALVRDVVGLAYREGLIDVPDAQGAVITAHSGGYLATASILGHGGLPIDEVQLYDALYGQLSTYEAYARNGGVLRSVYTPAGGTVSTNQGLWTTLTGAGLSVGLDFGDATLRAHDVIIGASPASHNEVLRDDRNLQRWLQAALPPHAHAPPELLAVTSDGTTATVRWRDEGVPVRIETSDDGGATWIDAGEASGGLATCAAADSLRLRRPDGDPSDAYPASGASWLVVDGFDRFLGGSWGEVTHPFAAVLGEGLGQASGASNEAVAEGLVDLDAFDAVLWMLGDESTADRTFSEAEQDTLSDQVEGGGTLVVSGSEVGYATDAAFLRDVLHVSYVKDDAGTDLAGGHRFGVAYPEDYPDVLAGDETLWSYATGGAAAVVWGDRVAVVGFPLETLDPSTRSAALAEIAEAVGR